MTTATVVETVPNATSIESENTIVIMPLNARHIATINGRVTFTLAVLLNSLLLLVVSREQNTALRAYSNVMKLNCACDLLYSAICVLSGYQLEVDRGRIISILTGTFAHASRGWNMFGLWMYLTTAYTSLLIIPVVFYFRYSLIVKNMMLSTSQLVQAAAIPCLTAGVIASLVIWSHAVDATRETCAELLSHPLWTYGEYTVENCFVSSADNLILRVDVLIVSVANTAMYALIFHCAFAIFRKLKESDQRTSQLQRQMNMLLIAQMALPILCACLPLSVLVTMSFLHYRVIGIGLFLVIQLEWVPLLNPLVTILLVANYRRQATRLFCRPMEPFGFGSSKTATIAMQNTTISREHRH